MSPHGARATDGRARGQLSKLTGLFATSVMMVDTLRRREILRTAVATVPTLGRCRAAVGFHVDAAGRLERVSSPPLDPGPEVDRQVAQLRGAESAIEVPGCGWGRALPLTSLAGRLGYLVVGAPTEPTEDENFLLRVLTHQTASALSVAVLIDKERTAAAELRALNEQAAVTNEQLALAVADLTAQRRIHEKLTRTAAAGDGLAGVARTMHELTGFPVVVEDHFGNLLSWAGPGRPEDHHKPDRRERDDLIAALRHEGGPIWRDGRLVSLAQQRGEVLGTMALIDPDHQDGLHRTFAVEHGTTVLTLELAHQRSLAEVELRLRRDLVHDLIAGTDSDSATARASALGHDLNSRQHVLLVRWSGRANTAAVIVDAVERVTRELDLPCLVSPHSSAVAVITGADPPADELYRRLGRVLKTTAGAIGVGGAADEPSRLPRSHREAIQALETRQFSRPSNGVTRFAQLGIYRLLATGDNRQDIEAYVQEWLGHLLEYDAERGANLVQTLHQYLECGGNYDATAETLMIHRSTLRYRLQRIREITGFDLGDVEIRLNLHVAARAWKVLHGSV